MYFFSVYLLPILENSHILILQMWLSFHSLFLFAWDSNDIYVKLFDVPYLLNALFWLFHFYFNLDNFYWPIFKFTDYFLSCVESTDKPEVTRLSHSSSLLLCLWFLVFPFDFYTYLLLPVLYLFFRVFKIIINYEIISSLLLALRLICSFDL